MSEQENAGQETAGKTKAVTTTVTMEDGRVLDFVGKRKLLKSSEVVDGQLITRIDFINGKTVTFRAPKELYAKLAGHGAEQKLGDVAAGVEDIDDAFEAVAELALRLEAGEWNVKRESNGAAGGSVLLRALMEAYPAKGAEALRAFLATKNQAQKLALRNSDTIRPIVQRLEAAKAKKAAAPVDTDAMLSELDA